MNERFDLVTLTKYFFMTFQGIKTIGYGHNCKVDPDADSIKAPLTKAEGEALLRKDIKKFEKCVESYVKVDINSNQFSSLVSFAFNLGCNALKDSTLLSKLNQGDTEGAANEFGRWVHAGGKKLNGLVNRREAERKLFCK